MVIQLSRYTPRHCLGSIVSIVVRLVALNGLLRGHSAGQMPSRTAATKRLQVWSGYGSSRRGKRPPSWLTGISPAISSDNGHHPRDPHLGVAYFVTVRGEEALLDSWSPGASLAVFLSCALSYGFASRCRVGLCGLLAWSYRPKDSSARQAALGRLQCSLSTAARRPGH